MWLDHESRSSIIKPNDVACSTLQIGWPSNWILISLQFSARNFCAPLHPPPRSAPESSYIQFSKQENASSSRSVWIPRKHRKNARAENPGLKAYPMCLKVAINISVLFSVAVQGRRPVLRMPCRFKYRCVIKFAFMLFTVCAIGALFVIVFTPLPRDHPSQEDGLSDIVMETSKRNRFLGE